MTPFPFWLWVLSTLHQNVHEMNINLMSSLIVEVHICADNPSIYLQKPKSQMKIENQEPNEWLKFNLNNCNNNTKNTVLTSFQIWYWACLHTCTSRYCGVIGNPLMNTVDQLQFVFEREIKSFNWRFRFFNNCSTSKMLLILCFLFSFTLLTFCCLLSSVSDDEEEDCDCDFSLLESSSWMIKVVLFFLLFVDVDVVVIAAGKGLFDFSATIMGEDLVENVACFLFSNVNSKRK